MSVADAISAESAVLATVFRAFPLGACSVAAVAFPAAVFGAVLPCLVHQTHAISTTSCVTVAAFRADNMAAVSWTAEGALPLITEIVSARTQGSSRVLAEELLQGILT